MTSPPFSASHASSPSAISPDLDRIPESDPAGDPGRDPVDNPDRDPASDPVGFAPESDRALTPRDGAADDWDLWWGTFGDTPDARLQVCRCRKDGLNVGDPLLVLTVDDARRRRLDDRATALTFLRRRFGSGRYRLAPRTSTGTRLAGCQSQVVTIAEDAPMPVAMQTLPLPSAPSMSSDEATDRKTILEIERMRIQAEMEREREARRERSRDAREERRRERESERERKREEERKRRTDEERERIEREDRRQASMLGLMEKIAAGNSQPARREDDPLMQALLTKVLDRSEKRDDLSDFIKANAEMMRVQSTAQAEGFKQLMLTQVEAQRSLTAQAMETAMTRDGGNGWDGFGQVLSSTAGIIAALRTPSAPQQAVSPQTAVPRRRVTLIPASAAISTISPIPAAAPFTTSTPTPDPLSAMRFVRHIHRGDVPDDEANMQRLLCNLTPAMMTAIQTADQAALLASVRSALEADASLVA